MKQELTKIVLVETLGAINLGSVARLCENYGISELRLVSPRCNPNDLEATNMAVKGKKFLRNASVYKSLLEAIADCPKVIATCGRIDHNHEGIPIEDCENALKWVFSGQRDTPIAIVFGREDRGLTNKELLLANKTFSLNTSSSYPSLNLSHSVAIVLHELNKFNLITSKQTEINNFDPAFPRQLDDLIDDSKKLLLDIGFLLEHTSDSRMQKLKSLLIRGEIRQKEVSLIRGIVRQVRWAINNKDSI